MSGFKSTLVLIASIQLAACGGGSGGGNSSSPPPTEPLTRVSNTGCVAPDYPDVTASDLTLTAAFPDLPAIEKLVGLYQPANSSSDWYAVSQNGYVYRFDNSVSVSSYSIFLDISSNTYASSSETGLLGMAFHPDFSNNGQVFVYYMPRPNLSRLSRFTLNNTGAALDPASEKIILTLNQPATNHNGGGLGFGPDNYLYLGLGDGGGGGDTFGNGQNTQTLLGTLLRLDIDVSNDAISYEIPPGNPFANNGDGLPEIYAYGLRNPWRWSFDRNSGEIWVGDVGQNAIEEIDIITAGGNYGWPVMEGSQCYNSNQCNQNGLQLPVGEYLHSETGGCAITGGYVYRGRQIAGLNGRYVFGDFCTGVIYTLAPSANGYQREQMLDSSLLLSSFAEDNAGELYALNISGGAGQGIYKIRSANNPATASLIPEKLSDTGCLADTATQTMAAGVVAYDVNSPLWSDGADKTRYFAVPDNTRFSVSSDGDFIVPDNSVLIKNFYHAGNIIETRLMMKHINGWAGYSYQWNAGQTEAYLLSTGTKVMIDSSYSHIFPSRGQCLQCHTQAAGISLGIETLQLNHSTLDPANQSNNFLDTLWQLDYLNEPVPAALTQQKLYALDDSSASLQQKARSYLHSNCAGCHRPGGPIAGIDLRLQTQLQATGICGEAPGYGDLGQPGALLLTPGDAGLSVIALRMRDTGTSRMPPLGSDVVDEEAVAVIENWINSLSDCN